jgi:hypothetical protein
MTDKALDLAEQIEEVYGDMGAIADLIAAALSAAREERDGLWSGFLAMLAEGAKAGGYPETAKTIDRALAEVQSQLAALSPEGSTEGGE